MLVAAPAVNSTARAVVMLYRRGAFRPPELFPGMPARMNASSLPTSAVPWTTILAGTIGVLVSIIVVTLLRLPPSMSMPLMLICCAAPLWWCEWRRNHGIQPIHTQAASLDPAARVKRRSMSLRGSGVVTVLFAGSIFMQLRIGGAQIGALPELAVPLIVISVAWAIGYIFCSRQSIAPDSVQALALAVQSLIERRSLDAAERQVILEWCIKAFFLPLMIAWLYAWLMQFHNEIEGGLSSWYAAFVAGMAILYALDTLFATVGYLSTYRGIGGHIRSVNTTWLGWLSALVCYPPLSAVVLRQWLDYKDGVEWMHWLFDSPWLAFVWGGTILLLTAIYASATIVFGPRFSNLTHRGIITTGPFRWTKHPAYISKNLSWWLIAVPFVSSMGVGAALLNCLALLGVNFIYFVRARTEEWHLMEDPVYRQYAAWIDEHGLFSRLRRAIRRRSRAPA